MTATQRKSGRTLALLATVGLLLSACSIGGGNSASDEDAEAAAAQEPGSVTLAFGGDVHFEGPNLLPLLGQDDSTLGAVSKPLATADVAIVNLETAVTNSDEQADKELEDPALRYWFRTQPEALGILERSGVDAAVMSNNHGADYGVDGVRDAIAASEEYKLPLLGVGLDADTAFAPFTTTVRGTSVAVFAGDASPLESEDPVWQATEGSGPGLASARGEGADRLIAAVEQSAATTDVVAVYLHWGEEGSADPTDGQIELAQRLADAGANVVVGTHAHVPLGSGMLGDTYVNYGLGNLIWYHGGTPETGVLKVTVKDGEIVNDDWVPGRIPLDGGLPDKLLDDAAESAVAGWRLLRSRTDLAAPPGETQTLANAEDQLPAYEGTAVPINNAIAGRMTAHDEANCPVKLEDLRYLQMTYFGFDGLPHEGEMVVNAAVADDVVGVFRQLYEARLPIQTMTLVDEFEGDDNRSMAANNTSGYNCRRVAGSTTWSNHAYGQAIDINPVQNPYVVGDDVQPVAAQAYVDAQRGVGSRQVPGLILEGNPVTEAFADIGWRWGNTFPEGPDYQHFDLPR